MGISWYIIDLLYYVWLCSLLNPYTCDSWGDYISYWYLIEIIIPFIWNYIVHMYWHEIEYEQGSDKWRSSVLRSFCDYELGMWILCVGDDLILWKCIKVVCTGTWKCTIDHKLSKNLQEVFLYTIERSHGILMHIISWICITSHHIVYSCLIVCFIEVWVTFDYPFLVKVD